MEILVALAGLLAVGLVAAFAVWQARKAQEQALAAFRDAHQASMSLATRIAGQLENTVGGQPIHLAEQRLEMEKRTLDLEARKADLEMQIAKTRVDRESEIQRRQIDAMNRLSREGFDPAID